MNEIQKNKAEAIKEVAKAMAKQLQELLDLGIDSFATFTDTANEYMNGIERIIDDEE